MPDQISLDVQYVELTPEEQIERGHQLADAVRQLRLVLEDHKERKMIMRKEQEDIEIQIAWLAEVVRSAREERPILGESRRG